MNLVLSSHLPSGRLTNDQLAALYDQWTAEKIFAKTGVRERPVAAAEECGSDLAVRAAERLLDGKDRATIDALLFCTQTPDYFLPATACPIQVRLNLPRELMAFDLNQGCSGYIYSLASAFGLIRGGLARSVLILTGDTYSRIIHPLDKSTRTLFGDAGTATLLTTDGSDELHSFVFGTDGAGTSNLILRHGGFRFRDTAPGTGEWDSSGNFRDPSSLYMNGPEIFSFTTRVVPGLVQSILAKANLAKEQIDLFVFHQANRYLLEHLRRSLRIPEDRFLIDVEETGNTVSSSIPLALDRAQQRGRLRPGMRLMLVGFGVGYSWGGCIWEKHQ